jgi:hypothetical protein
VLLKTQITEDKLKRKGKIDSAKQGKSFIGRKLFVEIGHCLSNRNNIALQEIKYEAQSVRSFPRMVQFNLLSFVLAVGFRLKC